VPIVSDELKIDDFQLVQPPIASGSSSQVWEVRDGAGQSFAIKLLLPAALKDPEQVAVLKHESKVAQTLEHPNFARTLKFVKTKTHCYMLMELFRCPNLKGMLQNEPIAVQGRFARLVEQLCTALGYMHDKGWLHHDLKPDNILFSKGGDLKVIDFSLSMRKQGGLGKVFAGKVKTIQGTRTYIAPETIQKKYPTVQSDIYSLGITLFEVLAGQPPFTGSSPNELLRKHLAEKPAEPSAFNPNVTAEADKVILRMLSKKPAHRPKDMAEVASEFRAINVFKRDPLELAAEEEEKKKHGELGLDAKSRLDSRADAARVAAGVAAPAKAEPRKPTAGALAAAKAHAARQSQSPYSAGQPAAYQPGYQPAPAPAWPGYDQQAYWPQYPQAPAAPQPYYGYPPAAPAYPPAAPAGYAAPYPQQTAPPPQAPAPAQSAPVQPAVPPQAHPVAPAPAARPAAPAPQVPQYAAPGQGRNLSDRHPTQREAAEDLPEMEELPEVL
jgi:serine/threonine-protein kinase